MLLFLFIICVLELGVIVFQQVWHLKEKKDLHNRLMARDYPEYQHFETTHPQILKIEEARVEKEKKMSPEEFEKRKRASQL